MLEPILAFVHIAALLAVVVFLTSQAALCRPEWMNPAVVRRLAKVDLIYLVAAVALLLTGLARIIWGDKGMDWYLHNWLLHVKITAYIVIALMSLGPTFAYRRWLKALQRDGSLPLPTDVTRIRKLVMIEAHLIALVPLAAVFMARGYGSF